MWIPLHVHSQYSILDATSSVTQIAEKSAKYSIPAVALTDHSNLFGAIDFYKACKDVKIKPIIGCELYVAPYGRREKRKLEGTYRTSFPLVLLAKNEKGYKNLCKLSSIAYTEGFYYTPRIDNEILEELSEGLICLSSCVNSLIAHEILFGSRASTVSIIQKYLNLFGEDFYLEIQRHQMSEEDLKSDGLHKESWLHQQYLDHIKKQTTVNSTLIEIGKEFNVPIVATNDSHYIDRSDWRAHEILCNVQSGEPCEIWEKDSQGNSKFRIPNPKRDTYPSHEYYFKSPEQMKNLFSDNPEALVNTLQVADKCRLEIDFKTKHYPVYTPPSLIGKIHSQEEQVKETEKFLWHLCEEGINKRYNLEKLSKIQEIYPDQEPATVIRERLNYEMSIIVPKGMSDYLLIVWDFIHWAKQNDIPMGPGRGSGAGSIVLYLIGVTDIEPLRFSLFFERFINPERISYPDIDVDICMNRRGEVINYTLKKYGKENIAQIITFGTMKAKMSIKDVGRVLSVPLIKVNEIAKLIPEDLNITLDKALEKDPDLKIMYETDEEAKRVINLARKLEGSIRNTGIHAAGIIISGEPLTNLIPICNAKDSDMPVTQYSMKPVELVGMLKVDFLGLKTLTAIKLCVDSIKNRTGILIDWINLPLNDQATFELLNQGKTLGIFQLESGGMQDLTRNLHLDKFEEIIAIGALYRPGPMDMIPSFINRKHGREPIEYDHPWMKEILSETYGIMVYQEQVMQIASKLALYSLGEGDVLRRAMGKKDLDQMAQQREKFKEGCIKNGISIDTAIKVFDKMEKFASYGFNKSHAAAYGYLSYVTAYFKANYPGEWMASLMTCDSDDLSKVAKFIRECHAMNLPILPPDINEADSSFVATTQGIRFAMSGIKGVGTGVVESVISERKRGGHFKNLYQFCKRIDTKKLGKKVIEDLIDAGCFDFTDWSRDALRQSVDPMYDTASREQRDSKAGVLSLFSMLGDTAETQFLKPPTIKTPLTKLAILLREKSLMGFYLTGHPMDAYKKILQRLSAVPLSHLNDTKNESSYRCAFIVESVQVRVSAKTQKKFAILNISDGIEQYELPIWPELYEEKNHLLHENQLLYAVIQTEIKDDHLKLTCKWIDDLSRADDSMILACDQAFDKAKHQTVKYQNRPKTVSQKEGTQTKKIENNIKNMTAPVTKTPFHFNVDADSVRLSHILNLKNLFEKHRGSTAIQINFISNKQEMATLHIDPVWGVSLTPDFHEELTRLIEIFKA